MLDVLLTIIDRLIDFAKGRIEGRKEVFYRVIEPTFNDLVLIHGDYIKMFEEVQVFDGTWSDDESELARRTMRAKLRVKERRRDFEPIRRKVEAIAAELKAQTLPAEEANFVEAVVRYLPSGEPTLPQSAATTVIEYLDKAAPEQIDELIAATVQRHRHAWSDVSSAYARAKIAVAKAR